MLPVADPEQGREERSMSAAPALEDAWFSQSRVVPRSLSSRPPRAPSSPPPDIESIGDDTADDWFTAL